MDFAKLFDEIGKKLRKFGGVELAFGNPHTVGETTIIPVAKVSIAFGGGGGGGATGKKGFNINIQKGGKAPEKEEETTEPTEPTDSPKKAEDSFGGGGGGQAKTQPIGIFVLRGDSVKFFPVISIHDLFFAMGLISLLWWKFWRRRFSR